MASGFFCVIFYNQSFKSIGVGEDTELNQFIFIFTYVFTRAKMNA